jgi:hypothetical protein
MYALTKSRMLKFGLGYAGLAMLAGCSLQDFDSVQRDELSVAGSSSNGGSGGSTSGSGGSGGPSGEGGGGSTGSPSNMGGSDSPGVVPDAGADSGFYSEPGLVNGSFEQGYLGWVAEPPEVLGVYAFVQWPPMGSTTPDGLNEMSTWAETAAFDVRIFQSLTGLADGQYTLQGHFNFGTGHNAVRLFARNCGGADVELDVPQTLASQWHPTELTGIQVLGGNCQVGFLVDANAGNWLNTDLFSFEPVTD